MCGREFSHGKRKITIHGVTTPIIRRLGRSGGRRKISGILYTETKWERARSRKRPRLATGRNRSNPARNGDKDQQRPSYPLQYRIMRVVGRRIKPTPREGLHFLIPLVTYTDFHGCFREFTRIELNGKSRDELRARAVREGRQSSQYTKTCAFKPVPTSETRELWLWDGGRGPKCKLAAFLQLEQVHLTSVTGFGGVRRLERGDLAFAYHVKARWTQNPLLHTRQVKVWFSFAVMLTTGRIVRNPHTTLTEDERRRIDSHAKEFPAELSVRGRIEVHADFFRHPSEREPRADYANTINLTAESIDRDATDTEEAREIFEAQELANINAAAEQLHLAELAAAEDSD